MKKFLLGLVFVLLALCPLQAFAITAATSAAISEGITAVVGDGTYNYIGTNAGNVHKQTISSGAVSSTLVTTVPTAITALSLNGTTLYVTGANGTVYTVAAASSGLTDGVVYVGPAGVTGYVATWTMTREAAGRQSLVKTAAGDNSFLVADVTEIMRDFTSKGFKLSSIQYAYGIGTDNLTAHTMAVYKTAFTDNAAPTTSAVLAATNIYKIVGTVTSPYIRTGTIATPAWLDPFPSATENDKWTVEINVDASSNATATYRFYGFWLVFSHDFR